MSTVTGAIVENEVFNVFSGVTATETTVNSFGSVCVYSGGTATSTAINGAGKLFVFDGGTVTDTTVNISGGIYVTNGGKVTGALTLADGATVEVDAGVIDFDISGLTPDNAVLVNDLSLIGGTPSYTITVSETQELGVYTLAGGAASFAETVTVFTDLGADLGTITVGGTLSSGDYNYTLGNEGGTLSLA
ncbi:MAG: hypothetical protein IKS83_04490, partial [Victivallales bacterium]|nr:hypothetical protein [Victivallales bacterium]